MAQALNLRPYLRAPNCLYAPSINSLNFRSSVPQNQHPKWTSLQLQLKSRGGCTCLFSPNRREEQARRSLESALGGKKDEFERWNKEIQKREQLGGGGDGSGGGWFGWRRWYDGDHFWEEAKQASIVILGLVFISLVIAKGEVMLAVIFNPLLFALRGTRNVLTYLTTLVSRTVSPSSGGSAVPLTVPQEVETLLSAKERVLRKWGSG